LSFEGLRESVQNFSPEIRETVGMRWADAALAEHASIASFSRFSLHLLAVGAPSELIASSHKAALDEIKHAKMCFSISSAYLGEDLSPGKLPLDGNVIGETDLCSIVTAAVVEGCIGETISAFEATLAMEKAQLKATRNTLSVIAGDELRHAQLSWRFVKWAMGQNEAAVKEAIGMGFDRVLSGSPLPEPPAKPAVLEIHGLLDDHARWHCHKQACEQIIAPAVSALLG
jgi:hypothetical protein